MCLNLEEKKTLQNKLEEHLEHIGYEATNKQTNARGNQMDFEHLLAIINE